MIASQFILASTPHTRVVRVIESLASIDPISVDNGTLFANLTLPSLVLATFTNGTQGDVNLNWLIGSYNKDVPGAYTIYADPEIGGQIRNPSNIQASIEITVGPITNFSPAFNIGSRDYAQRLYANTGHAWINTNQLWRPAAIWHNGKTHFFISRIPSAVPYGQMIDLVYDEFRGLDEEYVVGNVMSGPETHQYPAGIIDDAGNIRVVQENLHTTPLDVYTAANEDYTVFSKAAAAIGTLLAYANILRNTNGNYMIWSRGTGTEIYSSFMTIASSGFTGWAAQLQITETTVTQPYRHYPVTPMNATVGNWHHVMLSFRKDAGGEGIHSKTLWLKTPNDGGSTSGKLYYNMAETQSLNVESLGRPMTANEALARYLAHDTGSEDTQGYIPVAAVGADEHKYFIQIRGNSLQYYFFYEINNVWQSPVLITGISDIVDKGLVTQSGAFKFIIPYSRTDIRAYVERYTGEGTLFHTWEIRTTDLGTTWSIVRDLTPDLPTTEYATLFIPENILSIPANRNFPLLFVTSGNVIKVKPAAFGEVQPYAEPYVAPASDMTHASGLFNYKAASATLSGNTVTNLVDSFGLRNATPAGSPQWDPAQSAIVLNGTTQSFNIATTGIITLSAGTFIAVVKGNTGARIIFSVTNNTSNTRYWELQCGAAGIYTLNNVLAGGAVTVTGNTSSMNDSNFHILAFAWDGVRQVSIYIDGRKQKFVTNADDLTEWNTIGRGPNFVGTPNAVNIGRRDATSDVFSVIVFKELALYSQVLPKATLDSKIQLLADTYSIPLTTQFE